MTHILLGSLCKSLQVLGLANISYTTRQKFGDMIRSIRVAVVDELCLICKGSNEEDNGLVNKRRTYKRSVVFKKELTYTLNMAPE
jgi:hypothetical protein